MQKPIYEVNEGDFQLRLVSEKEQYNRGETVNLYGEITYIGSEDEVTIYHSSTAILFPMIEQIRNVEIGYGVQDIGVSTTLKRGEPYKIVYQKENVGYTMGHDDNAEFLKEFINSDTFLPGYYVVNSFTDFAVKIDDGDEEMERIELRAKIDFKVIE